MAQDDIRELKAELDRLQRRIDQLEGASTDEPVNRRNMLRGLGAAAVGAAAGGLAFARPAAAADGGNVVIGSANVANSPTAVLRDPTTYANGTPATGLLHVSDDSTSVGNVLSLITAVATNNGFDTAIHAEATTFAGRFDAPTPLKLTDSTNSGPPTTSGYTGSFHVDGGDLWYCVYDDGLFGGLNAEWKKVAGRDTAGQFHAITPARVYDSRRAAPAQGVLAGGANRTISVADKRDSGTGAVVTADIVPAGATAVAANVTIANTVGSGNLTVNPGGSLTASASTINWYASGQVLANGVTLALNASRQLTIIANGAGTSSTHIIVDVMGYYL
jgi:hypothetical protein